MNSAEHLILSDLDSTLLDRHGLFEVLPIAAVRAFPQIGSSEEFGAHIKSYYLPEGWDTHQQFADLGIDLNLPTNWERLVESIRAERQRLTGHPSLLFPEVPGALKRLRSQPGYTIAILSVNPDMNLRLKLAVCDEDLSGISARAVTGNKGQILASEWATSIIYAGVTYKSATVVDDHPSQIEAVPKRSEIERVQIVRPGQRYPASTNPDIRLIHSFDDIR